MKKIILISILFFGLTWSAPALAEKIDFFDAAIQINSDSSILVSEQIHYDFGNLVRHGIYRDIPYKYRARGGNFTTKISVTSVTDENGLAYQYRTATEGENLQIKIGDPDIYVSGKKVYVINYRVKRAINFFKDTDELYWNVTGTNWPVPIDSARATILLPSEIFASDVKLACFSGPFGSTSACSGLPITEEEMLNRLEFSQEMLASGSGLTVVVGFPKGLVNKPPLWKSVLETVKDNSVLFLPFLTLALFYYLWHTRGRDPKGQGIIVAQFEPPAGLTPAEMGVVYDERADQKDISAQIIHLAVNGYIKITKSEEKKWFFHKNDYLLEKLKPSDSLAGHEKLLLDALFKGRDTAALLTSAMAADQKKVLATVHVSALKNKFYKDLKTITDDIYNAVVVKGYFLKNPNKVRGVYVGIGTALSFLGFWVLGPFGIWSGLSVIASGIIIGAFGFFMPKKTEKGVLAREHIVGLKEYLNVAEKDRLAFHNAPQKTPERFEKLLPYAMVLGVDQAWAAQFAQIYNTEPSWYHDAGGGAFNSIVFVSSLNHFSTYTNSTLASSPRSAAGGGSGFGGGGFSGGGFGGGGGGSW